MRKLQRWTLVFGLWLGLGLTAAAPSAMAQAGANAGDTAPWATQLTYEPVSLGWTAQEVDRATRSNATAILLRARAEGASNCTGSCARAQAIFLRLLVVAR